MPVSVREFGKRRPPLRAGEQTRLTAPRDEPERLGLDLTGGLWRESDDAPPQVVPNSIGAGLLTGAVVGVLQMALHLHGTGDGDLHLGPLIIKGGDFPVLPLIIIGTLWAGGRAGFTAAFIVHALLRRLHRTSFADYAVAGGGAGIIVAVGMVVLGLGTPDQGWLAEAVVGAAAGALYRLFAGAAAA